MSGAHQSSGGVRFCKRRLAEIGVEIWNGETPSASDDDALRAVRAWVCRSIEAEPAYGAQLADGLRQPMIVRKYVLAAHWARNALPLITMSHKYAAALMATSVTPEIRPFIKLPWDVFAIELPNGLIEGRAADGELYRAETLFVSRLEKPTPEADTIYLVTTDTLMVVWGGVTDGGLAGDVPGTGGDGQSFALPFGDSERRICHLMQRLIANVCLAMSDPNNLKPLGKGRPHPPTKRKTGQPPLTTFQLGQSVDVDCRQAIRDYIEGVEPKPGKALALQMLVRGHWKRQHHGEHNTKVKVIWVQPYWRGPDTAPILVRPHVMPKEMEVSA